MSGRLPAQPIPDLRGKMISPNVLASHHGPDMSSVGASEGVRYLIIGNSGAGKVALHAFFCNVNEFCSIRMLEYTGETTGVRLSVASFVFGHRLLASWMGCDTRR